MLLRSSFANQAQWHMTVAHRALVAKGHVFTMRGSCFDLECQKPRAPQCEQCFATFPISKVHALAKAEGECHAVATVARPPLVQPQRLLPKQVDRLGTFCVHESHLLGQYRGRLWCFACAATMAVTSPVAPALRRECPDKVVETAKRNLGWLAKGELPPGWRSVADWPKWPEFALRHFA